MNWRRRSIHSRLRKAIATLALLLPGVAAMAESKAGPVTTAGAAGLAVTGMTFVQSEGDKATMVVEADRGRLDPKTNVVHLDVVKTRVEGSAERAGFDLTCDEGELVLETHALLATGNVHGRTADGRNFATSWVRYDPAKEVAFTDAPVEIEDASGSLRGGGFRYHVREGRFRLLGGATVRREN
jgi:LPS export ABC transporter protein LptC